MSLMAPVLLLRVRFERRDNIYKPICTLVRFRSASEALNKRFFRDSLSPQALSAGFLKTQEEELSHVMMRLGES